MSVKAPILNNEEVTKAFTKAQEDPKFAFLKIGIDLDKNQFELRKVETADNETKIWEKINAQLEVNGHCYFVIRDPLNKKMYVLLHWGPDLSPVKQRMLYSSSRATLKNFLGQAAFSEDYYMNTKEDCSAKKMMDQRTMHEKIDFRSDSEIDKMAASIESAPKSAQSSVMQKLPINMTDTVERCVGKYLNDKCKVVILKLSEDKKSILAEEQKEDSIESIRELLPDDEPRYFMFWHTRIREDEEVPEAPTVRVFGYYCPEKCERSLKFTYSTCKTNVIDYCTEHELTFEGKIEITGKDELTHEYLDYHVFPLKEEKQMFETPKAPGQKKKTRGKKKFEEDT